MASSKMFALFAIVALSWSAAAAAIFPQVTPPTAAWATINHPCLQYCMLQQPFAIAGSPFASMILQQPWASFLLQQQCNCAFVSQMIQQQQMLNIFNPMAVTTPLSCLTNPLAAAMQLPYFYNPMVSSMFNPVPATMQMSSVFNPFTMGSPAAYFQPFAAGACF